MIAIMWTVCALLAITGITTMVRLIKHGSPGKMLWPFLILLLTAYLLVAYYGDFWDLLG